MHTAAENLETDRLASLIEAKQSILVQLRELTRRQSAVVDEGNMPRLIGVLAAKQTCLAQLQEVERQLDPFRDQDPDRRRWRTPEARQQARKTAEASAELLEQIMELERDCELQLRRRRQDVAGRLEGVHDSSRARAAYMQGSGPRAGQLDISSES